MPKIKLSTRMLHWDRSPVLMAWGEVSSAWKARDKARMYSLMFGRETAEGHNFAVLILAMIAISVLVLMVDSVVANSAPRFHIFLKVVEWAFTLIFTAEYALRLWCSPRPFVYARSFFGVVDFLAIAPAYLSLLVGGAHSLMVLRLLRMLRLFRIMRMDDYWQESNMLLRSLYASRRKIIVFLITIFVAAVIFGTLVFVVEGGENGFTSIPRSIYWAVVTITTVGYGDMSPHSAVGQAIATLVMLVGYSIIAVPTGIFTAEMLNHLRTDRKIIKCPSCEQRNHEIDAVFCRHCGEKLPH